MTVYEGVFYLTGLAIAAAAVGVEFGIGYAAIVAGGGLITLAVIGEWEAAQ